MSKDIYSIHKSLCDFFDQDSSINPIPNSIFHQLPTQEYVKNLFDYRDGLLYRKNSAAFGKVKRGDLASRLSKSHNRRRVCIDNVCYPSHRIIFLFHHGFWPEIVDHIDCNPLNDRIENLRAATTRQNNCNQRIRKDNTTGIKGVSIYERLKCVHAQIQHKGKKYHKHFYPITEENIMMAKEWVSEKRNELHGEFARGE